MFRSVCMTFWGTSRVDHDVAHHVHESPPLMTVPLMILAGLSLVGGFVGIPVIPGLHHFSDFIAPVFAPAKAIIEHGAHHAGHHSLFNEFLLMGVSLAIGFAGLFLAYWMYVSDTKMPDRIIQTFPGLHKLVYNKYWMDQVYDILFVNSIVDFSRWLWKAFDETVIDGIVNGGAAVTRGSGRVLSWIETGLVKDYALSIAIGVLFVIGYFVLM
jgi:NADH-quinone oxidoreductase subunit L